MFETKFLLKESIYDKAMNLIHQSLLYISISHIHLKILYKKFYYIYKKLVIFDDFYSWIYNYFHFRLKIIITYGIKKIIKAILW